MLEFKLTINPATESFEIVNLNTGEVKSVNLPTTKTTKKTSKKASKDENPNPQIKLCENKYELNSAAVELMGVNPDDRLHIKMEKNKNSFTPTIGTNESFGIKGGNRLTKSFTVSCRGKANEELSTYGTIFNIEAHPKKEGIFYMYGDAVATPITEDEGEEEVTIEDSYSNNISMDDSNEETINIDLDALDINDEEDSELQAFDFSL